jgi:hypothetical protein
MISLDQKRVTTLAEIQVPTNASIEAIPQQAHL